MTVTRDLFRLGLMSDIRYVVRRLRGSPGFTAAAVISLLDSLLFGLTPTDPATLIAAAATMLAVVMIAGAVPARRAARIDPLTAIRTE